MSSGARILLAGGGTGGHVYPAIAIADEIRKQDPDAAIAFAGTTTALEWRAVPDAGYEIHPITVSGFKRRLTLENLSFPAKLLKGLKQSYDLVGGFAPTVAVGTGGYVSGPVLKAAAMRKTPVVIQEQNAFPGKTNLLLSGSAREIHIAFPEARDRFNGKACKLTGNPTREALRHTDPEEARRYFGIPDGATVLFVFGGSLGSAAINRVMKQHVMSLLEREGLFVIWQTGRRYYDEIRAAVDTHGHLAILEYVDRMDYAYTAADMALCRAGAITCSELSVTGTPAILVPSPNVAEDHQTHNAQSMADAGAAILVPEKELDETIEELIQSLMSDSVKRLAMSRRSLDRAFPDAARKIAESVLVIANESTGYERNG